jgi:hypothetical protein
MSALLLCETVIVEANTNTKTLVRVSDLLRRGSFPARTAAYVYLKITDAEGDYLLRLEYVHGATGETIDSVDIGVIRAVDRLRYYDAVVPATLNIPEPGRYEIRLLANGRYIGTAKLEVLAPPR